MNGDEQRLRIRQVSARVRGGGAEQVALDLHHALRALGHDVSLVAGRGVPEDATMRRLDNDGRRNPWSRGLGRLAMRLDRGPGAAARAGSLVRAMARPLKYARRALGHEDFNQPATTSVLAAPRPDVLHLHNLHGDYFDLRLLPAISRQVPTFVTLHDMWLLTGGCHHALECERWRTECGACPHLDLTPWVKRDRTAANRREKAAILAGCRLFVSAPSRWLLDKVPASILGPAVVETQTIPNGVDLETFQPGDRRAAREALGLPDEAAILLTVGTGLQTHPYKDFATAERTAARVAAAAPGRTVILLVLGETGGDTRAGAAKVRYLGHLAERSAVARCYRAADVYLHAARAETFPTVILEAMACGIPVVATSVGGVPEQVRDEGTGLLAPVGDAEALAAHVGRVLDTPGCATALGDAARAEAVTRFDLRGQARQFAAWYGAVLEHFDTTARRPNPASPPA